MKINNMDNFQQTVDLRKKIEKQRTPPPKKNAEVLEEIFTEEILTVEQAGKPNLRTISRPLTRQPRQGLIKIVVFILAFLMVGATVYFLFYRHKGAAVNPKAQAWYAVKLVDGEIFYGQISDVKADPVVVNNAYYNYDQAQQTAAGKKDLSQSFEETGNIRLVKRGQETHGPTGSMDVVRAQVLFMEPLKADSKVLQAILNYEK